MSEIDGGENHAEQDAAVVAAATHIARLLRRWCVGRSTLTRFGGISTLQTRLVRDDEMIQAKVKSYQVKRLERVTRTGKPDETL